MPSLRTDGRPMGTARGKLSGTGLADFNIKHPRRTDGKFGSGASPTPGTAARRLGIARPVLTGEAALNSVPAKMTRPPRGRSGDYSGAKLEAPKGHGDVLALAEYEGLEYTGINGLLRGDYDRPFEPEKWRTPEENEKQRVFIENYRAERKAENLPRVAEIDKTMAVSPLPQDIETERVVRHGRQIWGDAIWYGDTDFTATDDFDEQDRRYNRWLAGERPDLTGLRWSELAYVSTSASDTFGAHHARHWHSDQGEGEPILMKVTAPAGVGAIQLSEWGEVGEILLQRGLQMEITKDHGVDDKGFRRLDVRVISPDED